MHITVNLKIYQGILQRMSIKNFCCCFLLLYNARRRSPSIKARATSTAAVTVVTDGSPEKVSIANPRKTRKTRKAIKKKNRKRERSPSPLSSSDDRRQLAAETSGSPNSRINSRNPKIDANLGRVCNSGHSISFLCVYMHARIHRAAVAKLYYKKCIY